MKKRYFIKTLLVLSLFLSLAIAAVGCATKEKPQEEAQQGQVAPEKVKLILATTTSTYDSGLLDALKPAFEEKYGYNLQILAKGTGAALKLGQQGDADVLLVHAKQRELALVEEGYFTDRHDVMYNDFIIIGPKNDPAGIKGKEKAAEAYAAIAEAKAPFASRGDDSGTNIKEKSIWTEANIEPQGEWYLSLGQGMGDTLRVANEKQAYTFTDRGTYLSMKDKLNLDILVEGDPILFNQYGVMATNPEKNKNVNYEGAKKFIEFMISDEGQKMIGDYKKYGEQLFTPNAE